MVLSSSSLLVVLLVLLLLSKPRNKDCFKSYSHNHLDSQATMDDDAVSVTDSAGPIALGQTTTPPLDHRKLSRVISENAMQAQLQSIPEHHSKGTDHVAGPLNPSTMLAVRVDEDGGEVRMLKAPKALYKPGSLATAPPRPRIPLPYRIAYPGPSGTDDSFLWHLIPSSSLSGLTAPPDRHHARYHPPTSLDGIVLRSVPLPRAHTAHSRRRTLC